MATATVNKVAYLSSNFTPTIIAGIKNGTYTTTAVYLVDSVNEEGRPTVQLHDGGATDIFGFIERDISGDVLNPQSVDSNGNVTYNAIGTVKRSGVVRVIKRSAPAGAITAGQTSDIGKGIRGWSGGIGNNAPRGSVAVAATGGFGKIIAYSGNYLFVLLD